MPEGDFSPILLVIIYGAIGIIIDALLIDAVIMTSDTARSRKKVLIASVFCPFPSLARFATTEQQEEAQRTYILAITFLWLALPFVHLWRFCFRPKQPRSSTAP